MKKEEKYLRGVGKRFWKNFVAPMVKKLKGNKCEECNSKRFLDIHHLDYKTLVNINTLLVLCRGCHKQYH